MRTKMAQPWLRTKLVLPAMLCATLTLLAQKTQWQPPTDTSAQASPVAPAPAAKPVDSSSQASPISLGHAVAPSVAPHTAIPIRLATAIDSGHLKNGQTLHATLTSPVTLSPRGILAAGTPAELTVVETLPAGRLYAAGEFSLQLLQVGRISVYTNTLTFRGKPGHKDLPDSAPAVGTDAGLPAGAPLTFHVLPPPTAVTGPPRNGKRSPGSVDGVAVGGPPPPGSSKVQGKANTKGAKAQPVQPADNTFAPAQTLDKSSPAPNQPSSPQNSTPANSTQPH